MYPGDENTGALYVAGLWMHGVLDPKNGKWVKNLNDTYHCLEPPMEKFWFTTRI
jgi:hypothetical protein